VTEPTNGHESRSRVTIREIADLAGVSIATVSRVVNGRGDVSAETRELVQRVVREHGYSVNRSARGLSGGRTGFVGVTIPKVHPVYFSSILSGAAEALYEQDMRIVLCPTEHQHDREVGLLERLMHGTTDGALLVLPEETNEELENLLNHGYRFVVVDPLMHLNERIPAVSAANSSGANQAVKHLVGLGHRRIGAITGPTGWLATEERRGGYHAALASAGIMPDPALEIPTDFQIEGGIEAAGRLLDAPDRPTAIFGFNDNVAIGAMHAARARGLRIPDDVSIVGFDGISLGAHSRISLTTIAQPSAQMGEQGVELLVRRIAAPGEAGLRQVRLEPQLVERGSTGPPPGAR
jgi:LacI family transcriptional regulator